MIQPAAAEPTTMVQIRAASSAQATEAFEKWRTQIIY
jgi:hypothetical protein